MISIQDMLVTECDSMQHGCGYRLANQVSDNGIMLPPGPFHLGGQDVSEIPGLVCESVKVAGKV